MIYKVFQSLQSSIKYIIFYIIDKLVKAPAPAAYELVSAFALYTHHHHHHENFPLLFLSPLWSDLSM